MNKDFTKMTDQELAEAMEQMKAEQDVRAKAAEEKRKAEEEAKRKAEEAKRQAEEEKKSKALVEMQKTALGKYFKYVVYDVNYKYPTPLYTTYYKVIGVYEDKAIVECVKKNSYIGSSIFVSFVTLEDILNPKDYKIITCEEYENEYKSVNATFNLNDVVDTVKKMFNFSF